VKAIFFNEANSIVVPPKRIPGKHKKTSSTSVETCKNAILQGKGLPSLSINLQGQTVGFEGNDYRLNFPFLEKKGSLSGLPEFPAAHH